MEVGRPRPAVSRKWEVGGGTRRNPADAGKAGGQARGVPTRLGNVSWPQAAGGPPRVPLVLLAMKSDISLTKATSPSE